MTHYRKRERWQLTRTELKAMEHVRKGLPAKAIAHRMHITVRGVKHHLTNIYRKFGVTNRVELHKVVGFHGQ